MRLLSSLLLASVLAGCTPGNPTLAQLSSPVVSLQRRMSGPLLVVLSYDTQRTPCGTVEGLTATLDGATLGGSAGQRVKDPQTGVETCEFPNYAATLNFSGQPRALTLSDGVTTIAVTADTLEVGSALPASPPATIRSGAMLRWSTSAPASGTSSWKVDFTPTGGAAATWSEGTTLPAQVDVAVPAVDRSVSGTVALSWLVNAAVTRCEAVASCELTLQGASSFSAVIAP